MAYPCRIWLKNECDGCGACESDTIGPFNRRRPYTFNEDYYDPFEVDEEEGFD